MKIPIRLPSVASLSSAILWLALASGAGPAAAAVAVGASPERANSGAGATAEPAVVLGAPIDELRSRRDRLVAELRKDLEGDERGVFYMKSDLAPENDEFRAGSAFYYLTGLSIPEAGLLLSFDKDSSSERLYLKPRNPAQERWTGPAVGPGRVDAPTLKADDERRRTEEVTGFRGSGSAGSGIREIGDLRRDLSNALGSGAKLFLDYAPPGLDDPPTPESTLVAEIRSRYPDARIASASGALTKLRLVKSPGEIEAIRRAVSITCEAQRAAMRTLKPGMRENDVEAVVEYVFTKSGARFNAFPTIVGSGPNSCVLHYDRNERTIGEGDLVVVDAGAEYGRYASDVTRTIPASGRFSDEQRRVYEAVLKAQTEGKALVRPGSRIRDIHERASKVLEEAGLGDRFLHGCCHFVGLDVHDVGGRDVLLEPGMVLTVEPGAYIPESSLGVRIEDVFLVTEKGSEQLSACVPSSIADVEAEMKKEIVWPSLEESSRTPAKRSSR